MATKRYEGTETELLNFNSASKNLHMVGEISQFICGKIMPQIIWWSFTYWAFWFQFNPFYYASENIVFSFFIKFLELIKIITHGISHA